MKTVSPMNNSVESPLKQLRSQTQEAHDRIEGVMRNRFFSGETMSEEGLIELLESYYGLYHGLDRLLVRGVEQYVPTYEYEQRVPRIRRDLGILGQSDDRIDSLPRLTEEELDPPDSIHDLLGTLYVVVGSEKGNAVIRKTLEEDLSAKALEADHYFHGNGPPDGEWTGLRDAIDRTVSTDQQLSSLINSARQTFELYEEWFHDGTSI